MIVLASGEAVKSNLMRIPSDADHRSEAMAIAIPN